MKKIATHRWILVIFLYLCIMEKNEIRNILIRLMSISIIFNSDSGIKYESVDYLEEKWDRLIGTDPDLEIEIESVPDWDDKIDKYLKFWDREADESIRRKIYWILSTKKDKSLRNIIMTYQKYIGELNRVKCSNVESVHPLLIKYCEAFLEEYESERYLNRYLKLYKIIRGD